MPARPPCLRTSVELLAAMERHVREVASSVGEEERRRARKGRQGERREGEEREEKEEREKEGRHTCGGGGGE